jgi:ubiquinone/menaquinone biosynthesis C-methylase UbiE/uncharacterized protein YbaR (Trm112 family)
MQEPRAWAGLLCCCGVALEETRDLKRSTLELLCCPNCQAALTLHDDGDGEVVDEGRLSCPQCERIFPIKDGIPHFIELQELEGLNRSLARFYERFSRLEAMLDKLAFLHMGGERQARGEILNRLELGGGRILEVSIGAGANLPYLFESGKVGQVYGLDISPAQLVHCRKLVAKRGWPVDLFLAMAEALPFKAESFDNVFHIGGINFFSDKKKAIDEMIRVARPGSKIVIADESERAAQMIAGLLRLRSSNQGKKVDTSAPIHLVPAVRCTPEAERCMK